jgi:hypothetical protein
VLPSSVVSHPTPENRIPEGKVASVIGMADEPSAPDLRDLAERLRQARQALSIGATDGDLGSVFDSIVDVVATRDDILILDSANRRLRVFDRDGRFKLERPALPTTGVSGSSPTRLVLSPEGSLWVMSRWRGAFSGGPALGSQVTLTPAETHPADMCLLDDHLFFYGLGVDGTAVHEHSPSGEHIRSFGVAYRSANKGLAGALTDGSIVASLEPKGVVVMSRHLPYLWAYSTEGALRWVARLEAFRTPRILEKTWRSGRHAFTIFEGDDIDTLAALVVVDGRHVLVQTYRGRELRSYVVRTEDGKGLYVGNSLPRVHSVALPWLYASESTPFPRVLVYRAPDRDALPAQAGGAHPKADGV